MNGQPTSVEEEAQIAALAANGTSTTKIAATLGRSRAMVRHTLAKPEIQRTIKDEKAELSAMYREKARNILVSIDDAVIEKGNLLQRATSTGILLDKSLLLAGDPTTNVNVTVLMEVVDAIKAQHEAEQARLQQQIKARTIEAPK